MSKPPSEFFLFIKENAVAGSNGIAKVTVELPLKEFDRLYKEAKEHEVFYSSEESDDGMGSDPETTEGEDGKTPPNDSLLREIRQESKLALANLKDRRSTLQSIVAIIDKNLGEE